MSDFADIPVLFDTSSDSSSSVESVNAPEEEAPVGDGPCYRCGEAVVRGKPLLQCRGGCYRRMHESCNDSALDSLFPDDIPDSCGRQYCCFCNEEQASRLMTKRLKCDAGCDEPCLAAALYGPKSFTYESEVVDAMKPEEFSDVLKRITAQAAAFVAEHPIMDPVVAKPYVAVPHTITDRTLDEIQAVVDSARSKDMKICALRDLGRLCGAQSLYTDCYTRRSKSTYSRFFTQKENLKAIADKLNREFLREDDVYVDFSCGTNEFGAMLRVKHFIGFDIFPPSHFSCRDHFRLVNWFDVTSLPKHCVIGLNPPFGAKGRLAKQFCDHAISFQPRLLVLIIPESSGFNPESKGYTLLHRDELIFKDDAFYVPSSKRKPSAQNHAIIVKDSPVLLVYGRKE